MKPIIVPSNEYQKMCKDMNNIGSIIEVHSRGFSWQYGFNQFVPDNGILITSRSLNERTDLPILPTYGLEPPNPTDG